MIIDSQMKQNIISFFSGTPVESAYLFGSYATGDATPESDLDILVKLPENINLLQLAKMKRRLELETGKSVDLLTEEAIAPDIRTFVDKQKVLIYERKR